jgi:hypothetical protein
VRLKGIQNFTRKRNIGLDLTGQGKQICPAMHRIQIGNRPVSGIRAGMMMVPGALALMDVIIVTSKCVIERTASDKECQ